MADRTEPLLNAKTVAGNAGNTSRMDSDGPGTFLPFGDEVIDFVAKSGKHYLIDFGILIGEGGESGIYDAQDSDGATFVAKVYEVPEAREWSDHRRVIEALAEYTKGGLARCKSTHLMPVFDHGILRYGSRDYVVLILPYCECLGDVPIKTNVLKGKVIPAVATALKFLHDRSFVHRDVKPSNIFLYEDVVVLGDFGISTIFKPGEENRATRRRRGTEGYLPGSLVVNLQLDWYSFGYTIWTMYNDNVHPHQALIDSGAIADVWAGKRPIAFQLKSEADTSLRSLVYGLVDESADRRFGYDEVMRWRRDPVGFAAWCESRVSIAEGGTGWGRPYKFNGVLCTDGPQLAREMANDWEFACQHLFEGDIVDHFRSVGDNDLHTKLKVIVNDDGGLHQDCGLAKAIFLISGEDQLLVWRGKPLSLETISKDFEANGPDVTDYDDVFREGLLSWYLEQANRGAGQLDKATALVQQVVRSVERLSKDRPRLARLVFMHCLNGGAGTRYEDVKDVNDLAKRLLGDAGNLRSNILYDRAEDSGMREELVAALSPYLARRGMLDEVGKLASESESIFGLGQNDVLTFVGKYLLLLDQLADGCAVAREFAATYGPSAPWFWVGRNAELYDVVQNAPHANEATEALKGVASNVPQRGASVRDIQQLGTAAFRHCDVIRGSMDISPMAAYAGVRTNKPVVARCDDALFCSSFFGMTVPRGFVRSYLQASVTDDAQGLRSLPFSRAKVTKKDDVRLLSQQVRNDTAYLTYAHDRCDEVLDSARQLETSVNGREVFRSVLASVVGILMLLAAPRLFLTAFDLDVSMLKELPPLAIAILFGPSIAGIPFLLLDAFRALRTLRAPATGRSVGKHIRQLRASLDERDEAFRNDRVDDRSTAEQLLCDMNQNQQHLSEDFSSTLDAQKRRVKSSSNQADSSLHKLLWRLSVTLVSLLMMFYAFAIVYQLKAYHSNELFGDEIRGFMMFIGAWIPGVTAVVCLYGWRQSTPDAALYSARGWLLTIVTVFLVSFSILWYVFIVLKLLGIMDPYYDAYFH